MKKNEQKKTKDFFKSRLICLVLLLQTALLIHANGIEIKGVITDESDLPMIGVSIMIKGTTIGVITNLDGAFSINAPNKDIILEISYIGYKTAQIKVGNESFINIKMEPDTQTLDELVVVGYGTVKKKDLTGAVVSLKSDDIIIAPTANAMEALQGKIAGMDIVKTSGEVDDGVSILLRGSRSIYGSNEPLFIIDGVPGSYNQVNPSDIESIDVLKDASSTAIYGSAGANGVIIITTKKGKAGKVSVNFDAYYGFSGKPNYKHGMLKDEWTDYHYEAYNYQNGHYPSDISALFGNQAYTNAYNNSEWIDWVDLITGNTATNQKYNVSVTGGSEKTKVFASASYNKIEGLLDNEVLNRYTLRLNIDQEIFDWAKIGFISNLSFKDKDSGENKTFTKALSSFPLGQPYDTNGNILHEYISGQYSPMGDFIADQYVNNTKATYVNVNGYLELTPVKGLSVKSRINGILSNSRQGQYWGEYCNALRPTYAGSPHASITNSYAWSYTWENIATYNITLKENHNIGGLFITSWNKNQDEMNIAGGSGQLVDRWSFWSLASAESKHIESEFSQSQKMSFAVRFNYDYKGRYLFNFSNRWDGVSWFSSGSKWDSFPAAAFAWRISDENFMKGTQKWLDNLKLRLGYGITGNSGGTGAYVTSTQAYVYTANGVSADGQIVPFTQYTGTFGTPNLGWEKSYNWNIGLDFGLFNNRIDGSVEYFTTNTKGLLFKRNLPVTNGYTGWGSPLSIWENLAKTQNSGIEISVNSHNIKAKDFNWNTGLSLSWGKEKIKKLPFGDIISENLFEGQPISTLFGYKYLGIWGTDTPQETLDAYGVKPGFIKVETLDNEGDGGVHLYGEKDRQILGHTNPNWVIGLNNSFQYKDFDLSIFMMSRLGQTIESKLIGTYTAEFDVKKNQLAGVDYWTEDNQGAYYPRPGSYSEQSKVMPSLRYRDGSFIKIKNITLGYSLPQNIASKLFMERCRFYFTAYNPFIFAKDKQLKETDPETNGSDRFPTYKEFVFGVNLTF